MLASRQSGRFAQAGRCPITSRPDVRGPPKACGRIPDPHAGAAKVISHRHHNKLDSTVGPAKSFEIMAVYFARCSQSIASGSS